MWLLLYLQAEQKREQLSLYAFEIADVHLEFSENIIIYQNFLLSGYKKEHFYTETLETDLDKYQKNLRLIHLKLNELKDRAENHNLHISDEFNSLLSKNMQLINHSDSLKFYMKIRGFSDFGWEGKMRVSAHKLQDLKDVDLGDILHLRRHEKDYMLRGDLEYKVAFGKLLDSLKQKYPENSIQTLLNNYSLAFNEYVRNSDSVGINTDYGITNEIKVSHNGINEIFSLMKAQNEKSTLNLKQQQTKYLIFQTIFIAFLAILISLFLVKGLTHDIKLLNKSFKDYIRSDFQKNLGSEFDKPKFKLSAIEFRMLFASFQLLRETLNRTVLRLNKEVEKSEKVVNEKTKFLANMSHEIRTPLNGILGMLQLINVENLSKDQKRNLELAEYSANHLLDVVNMILDYSKLKEEKIGIEDRSIDLCVISKNLEEIFWSQADEKNLNFEVEYDPKIPSRVNGDSMRIQQVLMNLLSNALKFTNQGSVSLKVNVISQNSAQVILLFEVTDTGEGIAENAKDKLFQAFEQKDISTTRKYGGTGLGLTISHQLVELMGGKLNLTSDVGKGSKFYFHLKFDIIHEPYPPQTTNSNFENEDFEFGDFRILVAEDNKINQLVIEKMLKRMKLNFKIVENGEKAFDLFKNENFDLILMDIHMPVMNGYEATSKIKSHPKYLLNKPPIIAITASAFAEDQEEAFQKGMDDFITKPIHFKKLSSKLNAYLPKTNNMY